MRAVPLIAGLLLAGLLAGGCGDARRVHAHSDLYEPRAAGAPSANLALGPSAFHAQAGPQFARRSGWPVADNGYRFDDVWRYQVFSYDEQLVYDRHNGLQQGAEAVRSGVLIR